MTSRVSLVIFDWDGTLMDSVGRIVSSMQTAATLSELPVPSVDAVKNIIGLSLEPAFQKLFPDASAIQKKHMLQHYRDQYLVQDPTPSPLFNGAEQVLQNLRDNNIMLAVATGKARIGLERVLELTGIGDYFITSCCADEAESKPSPDMLKQILQRLDVAVESALMVGDSQYDMQMAQRISMPRIGITHGVHGHEVLSQFGPKAIVDSLPELLKVI